MRLAFPNEILDSSRLFAEMDNEDEDDEHKDSNNPCTIHLSKKQKLKQKRLQSPSSLEKQSRACYYFNNFSTGCKNGPEICKFAHICSECGGPHTKKDGHPSTEQSKE